MNNKHYKYIIFCFIPSVLLFCTIQLLSEDSFIEKDLFCNKIKTKCFIKIKNIQEGNIKRIKTEYGVMNSGYEYFNITKCIIEPLNTNITFDLMYSKNYNLCYKLDSGMTSFNNIKSDNIKRDKMVLCYSNGQYTPSEACIPSSYISDLGIFNHILMISYYIIIPLIVTFNFVFVCNVYEIDTDLII